jgi:prepilin-type N-terminal cleavage/methylation domain-containing protein
MRSQRGFSLPELLVVTTVLGMVLAGITGLLIQGQAAYMQGSNRVEAQQNARLAVTLMSRELREACAVTSFSSTAIQFTMVEPSRGSAVECSSTTPGDILTVRYAFAGSTVFRVSSTGALPAITNCAGANAQYCLIGGVQGFTLTGYDSANSVTTTPSAACGIGVICSVVIQLETRSEESHASGSPGNVRARYSSRVRLRNV